MLIPTHQSRIILRQYGKQLDRRELAVPKSIASRLLMAMHNQLLKYSHTHTHIPIIATGVQSQERFVLVIKNYDQPCTIIRAHTHTHKSRLDYICCAICDVNYCKANNQSRGLYDECI